MSQQVKVYRELQFMKGATKVAGWVPDADGVCGVDITDSKSAISSELIQANYSLTSAGTFLTGSNITYSGGRGSSAIRVTGTFSGATGGFHAFHASISTSGSIATGGNGVIGVKCVVTNTAGMTDGEVYGAQFIAKHNSTTNIMTASASLIGCEAWAYISAAGPARTAIGGNFGWHNEATGGTFGGGSVVRGIQIFCDNNAGGNDPTESDGLCIWNQAGTITRAINVVQSGSGFTYFTRFASAAAPIAADTSNLPSAATYKIKCQCGTTEFYLIGVADF